MNNTMCLGLFLLVMHIQRLPWTYSSEVLVTVGESPPCLLHLNCEDLCQKHHIHAGMSGTW